MVFTEEEEPWTERHVPRWSQVPSVPHAQAHGPQSTSVLVELLVGMVVRNQTQVFDWRFLTYHRPMYTKLMVLLVVSRKDPPSH